MENGKITRNMDKVLKHIKMELNLKGLLKTGNQMVMEVQKILIGENVKEYLDQTSLGMPLFKTLAST